MNFLLLFWLFLKASLLSTGGLGNLPFLNHDLTALGWADSNDFLTAISVGNLSPGPTGLWSVSLGYLVGGWPGALLALLALSLPPLLILVVARFYQRIAGRPGVRDFTRGLSLGVVGLGLAVSYELARSSAADWRAALIAAAALALAMSKRVPVIVILLAAALAGVLLYGV